LAFESESCAMTHAEVRPARTTHNSKRLSFVIELLLYSAASKIF
jgi:hypothetical protein